MNADELGDLLFSTMNARAIHAAVSMGIFEMLAVRSLSLSKVAKKAKASRRGTEALLSALEANGLIQNSKRGYSLSKTSRDHLLSSSPASLVWQFIAQERDFRTLAHLEEAVKNGKLSNPGSRGRETRARIDFRNRLRHRANLASGEDRVLAKSLRLESAKALLDIGGGPGTFSTALCVANPGLRAVVLDLPRVCDSTKKILKGYDRTGRVSVFPANFMKEELPFGYDVALMFDIVHFLGERDVLRLLRKAHRCLKPGGALVIKDVMANDPAAKQRRNSALMSVQMLLYFADGKSYGVEEIRRLLGKAGFVGFQFLHPDRGAAYSLILARKKGQARRR